MTLARLACAAAVALATSAILAGSAVAGSYLVTQCTPPAGSHAFTFLNVSQFSTNVECPPAEGVVFSGLIAQDTLGAGGYPNGARGGYLVSAVSGTTITSISGRRYLATRDEDWNVGVRTAEGQVLENCVLNPETQIICERGHRTNPADADSGFAYSGLSTSSVAFDFICEAPGGAICARGLSQHQVWVVLYGATVTVNDPAPPVLGPISGSLLGAGATAGWHRGVESATVQSSDASGLKQARVLVDGRTQASTTKVCNYTSMRPCPGSISEALTLDLAGIEQGTHMLQFGATDAAGQETLSSPNVLKVDQTAPSSPQGLRAAPNTDGTWRLNWGNPPQGTAAPIVAAHYLVCQPGSSSDCPSGAMEAGANIQHFDATLPAGGGPWDLLVWLQDEAGNAIPSMAARVSVNTSTPMTPLPPPPAAPPLALPSPSLSSASKRPASLKFTRAYRRGATLYVKGTIRRAVTSRLSLSVRAKRNGRVRARGTTRPRRGRWQFRVPLHAASERQGEQSSRSATPEIECTRHKRSRAGLCPRGLALRGHDVRSLASN